MRLYIFILIALIATTVSCTKSGTADMQGYLMKKCGSSTPLSDVEVSLLLGNTTVLSATTAANGYFHIKGNYEIKTPLGKLYETYLEVKYKKITPTKWSNFDYRKLMHGPPDVFNTTLYLYNSTLSVLIVDCLKNSFGSNHDTIKVEYKDFNSNSLNDILHKKYIGPFTKGQILDTIVTPTDSHVGYSSVIPLFPNACNYYLNQNYRDAKSGKYPWVMNQPNNACGKYTPIHLKLD